MSNTNQTQGSTAIISITKGNNDTCDVQVEGHLDDIICMVAAAVLANEDLKKIFLSAIEVADMYTKFKENPSSLNLKNIASC